ncbi:Mn2+/Zn2+ ABC transporter substrate-binding protein [Suicoccus acidiformans]|uniref:Mn2+/Zn2+ ABC transporter substrate-binding protein n=1 Tax=Suicoccus acidiformans TaxID=2036206 RepID=A0A347WJ10_9LACT|nr:zinc ABC transporter substrate-binding protein [Suicoccus acidiformans]AXY25067.1 Mn2+/Zn2+ ABC transporter substrate-binding protein [Suicoccus acidiformans]
MKPFIQKILLTALTLGALSPLQAVSAQEPLKVVTSFYPMYEFTKAVGGDRVEVDMLVKGGSAPHGYEPSAGDIAAVSSADVFVYSSDEMEYWAQSLLGSVDNPDLVVIKASDNALAGHDHADDGHGEPAEGHDHDHEHDHAHEHEHEAEGEDAHNHEHETSEDAHDHSEAANGDITVKGVADHYHTGDVVTLQAETALADVAAWQWQSRANDSEDWQNLEGQTEPLLEKEAGEGSIQYQVQALDGDGHVLATSTPVDIHVDNHGELDPHTWLDPVAVQDQIDRIQAGLSEADPEGAETFAHNASTFKKELDQLDSEYRQAFEGAQQRTFVVQHEAFGHLAERYNLEQISVGGLSTEVEPSPARIGEITSLIKDLDISVIYYQEGGNTSIAQTIAAETNTDIAQLYDLEVAPQEGQLSYLDAMRANLEALQLTIK